MIPRPRRSTLFPTRRSSDLWRPERRIQGSAQRRAEGGCGLVGAAGRGQRRAVRGEDGAHGRPERIGVGTRGAERSEEHTLNSSHVEISYAVFCLKKKSKNTT